MERRHSERSAWFGLWEECWHDPAFTIPLRCPREKQAVEDVAKGLPERETKAKVVDVSPRYMGGAGNGRCGPECPGREDSSEKRPRNLKALLASSLEQESEK